MPIVFLLSSLCVCLCVCVCVCVLCVCVCVCVYVCERERERERVYVHVCVCIYVCVYSGMCVIRGNGWGVGGGVLCSRTTTVCTMCVYATQPTTLP